MSDDSDNERDGFIAEFDIDDGLWGAAELPHMYQEVFEDEPVLAGPGPPFPFWKLTCEGQPVLAGTDTGGGPLYVGRAVYVGHELPVKVAPEHHGAFLGWGGKEHSFFYGRYEVLHLLRGQAVWEEASDGDVPACAFPVGCTTRGLTVFAARVKHADTVTPGRLIPVEEACYISYGGREIGYRNYEVLTIV